MTDGAGPEDGGTTDSPTVKAPPPTSAESGPPKHRRWVSQALCAVLLFIVTLVVAGSSLRENEQLGYLGGMAEEYVDLAITLNDVGRLYPDPEVDYVFRPPGYVFFLSRVIAASGDWPDRPARFQSPAHRQAVQDRVEADIEWAQVLCLALGTVCLFLWIAAYCRCWVAFLWALAFGTNPYVVILTGLFHYTLFHLTMLVIVGWVLSIFLPRAKARPWLLAVPGVLFGLLTLARPVTLIFPFFLLLTCAVLWRKQWRRILTATGAFSLAFALVIAPYTVRNYELTGRFIPVNCQAGIVLWAATVNTEPAHPNHFRWWNSWYSEGIPIYERVTGTDRTDITTMVEHNVALNDAFGAAAAENLSSAPGRYATNVARNGWSFLTDINSVLISVFEAIQREGVDPNRDWFVVGQPQNFSSTADDDAFELLVLLLTMFCVVGIGLALLRRETELLVPAAIFTCLLVAHSITWMDFMYYAIKMPFLFIGCAYTTEMLLRSGPRARIISIAITSVACAGSMALTASVLFLS